MSDFALPADYPRVQRVSSFHELVTTPFKDGVNALCWERKLPGDFSEVVAHLHTREGISTLDEDTLRTLPLSAAGKAAVQVLLNDLRMLREHDLDPVLDCITNSLREADPGPVPTDVCSFHVDSATVEADTWLCTYHGPSSEGLRNEEAVRRVDIPETRAELLRLFGGEDDEGFCEHLSDQCYDLHYLPVGDARPFVFGQGNLWRIAVAYPGCPVPPCIHRAPETLLGQTPRLLLIS